MKKLYDHPTINRLYNDSKEYNLPDNNEIPEYAKEFVNNLSPKEYVNLLSGEYGHDRFINDHMDALKDHPHNNSKNNMEILKKLKHYSDHPEERGEELNRRPEHQLIARGKFDEKDFNKLIDQIHTGKYENTDLSDILKNPHLSKDNIKRALSKDGAIKFDNGKSKHLDKDLITELLNHNQLNVNSDIVNHPEFNEEHVKEVLKRGIAPVHSYDSLLGKLNPESKKKYLNHILGITGGEHTEKFDPEREDAEEFNSRNHDNWEHGPKYNEKLVEGLTDSNAVKHLTPDQVDHIIRHGTHDQRLNLFFNDKANPQDRARVYRNYLDGRNGPYGRDVDEEMQEYLREREQDDTSDYYDDAYNQASEEYPFDEFIKDTYGYDNDNILNRDSYIDDHLDNQDWSYKHPETGEEMDFSNERENHPDYNQKFDEADNAYDQALKKKRRELRHDESVQDAYIDSLSERESELAYEAMNDHIRNWDSHHEYVPEELLPYLPEVQQAKLEQAIKDEKDAKKKAALEEKQHGSFLDTSLANRSHEHPYGEGQHHHELVKEYADQNGGSIDLGHMNKMYPNQKDTWKKIFDGKGKLSSEEIQQKIDALPKTPYDISYSKWGKDKMQNINGQDQAIIRLDHSPKSLEMIKQNPELYKVFTKINDVSQRSGHPTNHNTIAWARVDTTNPKHWMVDELQSDFGSTARDYLKKEGKEDESKHVNTIMNLHKDWREALLNHVLKTAKQNGVEKVSTHSPESKAAHTGASKVHSVYADSYQKVPRKMGFKSSKGEELPLSEEGKKVFTSSKSGKDAEDLKQMHKDAMDLHAKRWHTHSSLANDSKDERELRNAHLDLAHQHGIRYKEHQQRLENLDPTHEFRRLKTPASYMERNDLDFGGKLAENIANSDAINFRDHAIKPEYETDSILNESPASNEMHEGHTFDLKPESFKKSIIFINNLIKSELYLYENANKLDTISLKNAIINIKELRKYVNNG